VKQPKFSAGYNYVKADYETLQADELRAYTA
jgi:hypothetical protein